MTEKHRSIIIFILFLTSSLFLQSTSISKISETTQYKEWYVDQRNNEGPWDGSSDHPFSYINDAIAVAQAYDSIFVMSGIYVEDIVLDSPVSLMGVFDPILDGSYNQTVIHISSNDVLISNFIIRNTGGYTEDSGVYVSSGTNITIENCIFYHTKNGLRLNGSCNVSVENCFFSDNGNGVYTLGTSDLVINSCDFAHNAIALVCIENDDLSLSNSTFKGNGICGIFYGGVSYKIVSCNLSNNSVNKGGFMFTNASDASISNCLFYHNGDGVSISNSAGVFISDCTFLKNTHFAVSMRTPSRDVSIYSCILSDNLRTALYIESGNQVQIEMSHLVGNYLYSISPEPSARYSAKNNWWGTPLGPFEPTMLLSNKIKGIQWMIDCIPWAKEPFQNSGATMTQIPQPLYDQTFDEEPFYALEGNDSDGDGVPDWWEIKWGYDPLVKDDHNTLDPDNDALTNLQECFTDSYGSNPFKKDIFLEIDWMQCPEQGYNQPNETMLQIVIESFAEHDVVLHIDIGELGGGEPIPNHCDHRVMYPALEDLYWNYFLHNNMTNPRKGIFHYGVICNYCPDLNFPFMGWNGFDGFAVSAQWLEDEYPRYDREQIIVGGLVHHLGHTLGLIADVFKGIDNVDVIRPFTIQWFNYNNYKSSMNYLYKFNIFTYSDGDNGQGDFDDWSSLRYDFFQHSDFPC